MLGLNNNIESFKMIAALFAAAALAGLASAEKRLIAFGDDNSTWCEPPPAPPARPPPFPVP